MLPTSFWYDNSGGRFRIYLGGLSTLNGLNLFSRGTPVSKVELYTDADVELHQLDPHGTIATLIDQLSILPSGIGIVDFSCMIGNDISFSTHDDCECHFEATTCEAVRKIVAAVAPASLCGGLWAVLQMSPASYIVATLEGKLRSYPDFDTLIASQDDGSGHADG